MKVNLVMTVKATIVFDGIFNYNEMSDKYYSLQEYIKVTKTLMKEHGFDSGIIVDAETGEILVEIIED